jgi:hypothetical protein
MKTPPLPIVVIAALDVVAAATSFLIVDQIGVVLALVEFVVFLGLAVGLWQLKKWAWLTELVICALQIAALIAGMCITLFASLDIPKEFPTGELLGYMVLMLILNILVVGMLVSRRVRIAFQYVTV